MPPRSRVEYQEDRVVQVQARTTYGCPRIYPINRAAKDLAALTGRKTLLPVDIVLIENLGYTIEWIPSVIKIESE